MKKLSLCLSALMACGTPGSSNTDPNNNATCTTEAVALVSNINIGNDSLFLTSSPYYQLSLVGDELFWLDPTAGPIMGLSKTGQIVAASKTTPGATRVVYQPASTSLVDLEVVGRDVFVMQTATVASTLSTQIYSLVGATATLVADAPVGTTWNPLFTRFVAADATHLYIQTQSEVIATGVETEQLIRIARAGGAQLVLTAKTALGTSNAQRGGDFLYFQGKQGFGSIYRVPVDGSSADVRLTPDTNTDGVDDDSRCLLPFFHSTGVYCRTLFEIVKFDASAANPVVLRDERLIEPTPPYAARISSIEGDRMYLIYGAGQTKSFPIQRMSTSGGAPTNVSCDRRVVFIAVNDESHIYWLERPKNDEPATLYRGPK